MLATPLLETTALGGGVIRGRTEVVSKEDGHCFEADRVVDSLIRYLGTASHSAHSQSLWIMPADDVVAVATGPLFCKVPS